MGLQSYKIYFNDGAIVIADSPAAFKGLPNLFYIDDDEIHKSFNILTSSVSTGKALNYGLINPEPEQIFRDFLDNYTVIQAAGGLVLNKENQLLTIKRNGIWDLPKGKIERHEDQRAAALREVMEETGLVTGRPTVSAEDVPPGRRADAPFWPLVGPSAGGGGFNPGLRRC